MASSSIEDVDFDGLVMSAAATAGGTGNVEDSAAAAAGRDREPEGLPPAAHLAPPLAETIDVAGAGGEALGGSVRIARIHKLDLNVAP